MIPTRWRDAVVPGLVALGLALVAAALTLVHLHGDVSRFVTAGSTWVAPRQGLTVRPGEGYDGQFVYRLALAPFDLRTTAHGITLDTPLRTQRIGLPALAWLVSLGGRPGLLPGVLVALGVLAVGAVGAVGGLLARSYGRHPAWGVLLAALPGFTFAVQHDLTEPLEIALLLTALLLWQRGRPLGAGAALAAATLTRETALLLAAAIALPRLWSFLRRRGRPGRADLAWLLPGVAFAGWQAVSTALLGVSPLRGDTSMNLAAPFVGPAHLLVNLTHADPRGVRLVVAQLVLVAALVVVALPALRRAPAPLPLAAGLAWAFAVCLSPFVWEGYDDLRFLLDPLVLTALVVLAGGRRLPLLGVLTAAVWLYTVAIRTT